MTDPSHVDLAFPVRGSRQLARDHGYALYGALTRALPQLHDAHWWGTQLVPGRMITPDVLDLGPGSTLRIRVPVDKIAAMLPLAGVTLDVHGAALTVGAPAVHPLTPAAELDAHLVVIKLTNGVPRPFDPAAFNQRFEAEARRQLARLEIEGVLSLRGRRAMTVGGRRVIGHAVRVSGLSADHSLKLQVAGIGGKRSMGCGVFRPSRERH